MVRKKIGTITLAVGLITVGVLLFAQNFIQLPVKDLYKYWPVLLIGLGLEMIAYMVIYGREGSNVKLGIDGLCIFFIIVLALYAEGAGFIDWKNPGHQFMGIHIGNYSFDGVRYHDQLREAYSKDNISSSYSIKEVKVSNDYGDIRVVPSGAKSVKVEAEIDVRYNDEQKAREYVKNAVDIKEGEITEIKPREITEAEKKDYSRANIQFTIYVPDNVSVTVDDQYGDIAVEKVNANVTVDDKNGEVTLDGITGNADITNAYGNVEVSSLSGDLKLTNKNGNITADRVSGTAAIDLSYGNVEIGDIGKDLKVTDKNGEINISKVAGNAEIDNSYGNIGIENVTGSLTIVDKNGNIEVGEVAGDAKINNSYGDIQYNSGNIDNASVYARTTYGDINCGKPLAVKKTNTQAELQGSLGTAKCKIEITTQNGNISIE